jgi:hypothetical protein
MITSAISATGKNFFQSFIVPRLSLLANGS